MARDRSLGLLFCICSILFINSEHARAFFESSANEFCIQTFNAYGPIYSSNRELRTEYLLEAFKKEGLCEALHFQEVWFQGHFQDLQEGLSNLTKWPTEIWSDSFPAKAAKSGLASFHSEDTLQSDIYVYENNEDGFLDWFRKLGGIQKALLIYEVKAARNQGEMIFANTHWHPTSERIRVAQAVEVVRYFYENKWTQRKPLILSGDFNTNPDTLEWKIIVHILGATDAYLQTQRAYTPEDCTYCPENPLSWDGSQRMMDYVFYRSSPSWILNPVSAEINLKTYFGVYLSDHYGLKIAFNMNEGTQSLKQNANDKKLALQTLDEAIDYLLDNGLEGAGSLVTFLTKLRSQAGSSSQDYAWWGQN